MTKESVNYAVLLEEYRKKSERTLPVMETINLNVLHVEAGLVGEVLGEIVDIFKKNLFYKKPIDKDHLSEEIGDAFFYLVGYRTLASNTFEERENTFIALQLEEYKKILNTLTKDPKITSKEEALLLMLMREKHQIGCAEAKTSLLTLGYLLLLCETYALPFQEVFDKNVKKLEARYPEGFSEEAAKNRDLEAEKKAVK